MHPGIPLQTGSGQFGCNDSFQQALILCPPTIQGRHGLFLIFSFSCHSTVSPFQTNRELIIPHCRNPYYHSETGRLLGSNGGVGASGQSGPPHPAPANQTWSHHTGKVDRSNSSDITGGHQTWMATDRPPVFIFFLNCRCGFKKNKIKSVGVTLSRFAFTGLV